MHGMILRLRPHLALCHRFTSSRYLTMSTSHNFILYAPDRADEATFARRMSVRPAHMVGTNELIARGVIKYVGAMLTPSSVESKTAEQKMIGSMIIYEAENIDVVRKTVENDIYYTSGVWDLEKIVILPFKPIPIP